jgi:hypothetical protein
VNCGSGLRLGLCRRIEHSHTNLQSRKRANVMSKNKISDHLESAMGNHSLQDSTSALIEVALDSAMEDGVLRDIPILGSLIGFGRAAISIRDRMLINKLGYFLKEIESVPSEQRRAMIDEINASEEAAVKVGEKVLYIVDRCQDHESSRAAGRIFRAFLEKEIDYSEFISMASAVDRLLFSDLVRFIMEEREWIPAWEASVYFGTRLIELNELATSVKDQWDGDSRNAYVVTDNDLTVSATELGRKFRKILFGINTQSTT